MAKISTEELAQLIKKHIEEKIPFSAIRLGDGEVRVLGYPDKITRKHLNYSLNYWFHYVNFSERHLQKMRKMLFFACQNADVIGVPRPEQIAKNQDYARVEQFLNHYKLITEETKLTSCGFHRHLYEENLYHSILDNLKSVHCITCRNITQELKETFNIERVEMLLIPEESHTSHKLSTHYPGRFNQLVEILHHRISTGEVYLVGAGVLGKIYCNVIKARGGIAIDIGSMFDAWAGVSSRSFIDKADYKLKKSEEKTKERKILTVREFTDLVKGCQKKRESLSLVRCGDGMNFYLGYPELSYQTKNFVRVNKRFGVNFSTEQICEIRDVLKETILNADVLGLPVKEPRENVVKCGHKKFNWWADWYNVEPYLDYYNLITEKHKFVSFDINGELQKQNLYHEILDNQDIVYYINNVDMRDKLKEVFKLGEIVWIPVPGYFRSPQHYPNRYEEIRELLFSYSKEQVQGKIFLVGAGIFARVYCEWIKQAGGIGIDVASIFYAWNNVKCRFFKGNKLDPKYSLK